MRARALTWEASGGFVVLATIAVILVIAEPVIATPGNLRTIAVQASPLAIAVFGQAIAIAVGEIDLSSGAIAALVSMVGVFASQRFGAYAGWIAGIAVGTLLGMGNGALIAYARIPSFIATFGMLTAAAGVALLIGGGVPAEFPAAPYTVIGQGAVGIVPISLLIAVAVGGALYALSTRTVFGRYVYAIGGNEATARLSGVPIAAVRFRAFALVGALSGLAGIILSARVASGQPNLHPELPFEAIAALAIGGFSLGGGRGSIAQAACGTLTFTLLANGLNIANVSTYIQQMSVGAVTIAALVLIQSRGVGTWLGRRLRREVRS